MRDGARRPGREPRAHRVGPHGVGAHGLDPHRLGRTGSARTGSARTVRGNLGAGLVEVDPVPYRDPATVVLATAEVPERKRWCGRCGRPVGRARGGAPGRPEGFCPGCGNGYSFVPKLAPGELVAGQYEVVGCLAHGGLGWIYLARDSNVSDRWVVLKGLLDSGDPDAMEAAIAERRFLARVEHPNIVRIYNFVQHEGSGYIVMEYVGGRSLKDVRGAVPGPLPLPQAIALVLEILPALGYLHGQGLLYCDFKPDNVVQTEEQLKLIDLGGVRGIDDDATAIYGTQGYQAPEVPADGATVASDLYTVGRTLAVLSLEVSGFTDPERYATRLPDPADAPLLARYPSFHRFLLRATEADAGLRFGSASEMAGQLLGVLREVVALDGAAPAPAPSAMFSPELGGDLHRPDPAVLPVPVAYPGDPAAGLLLTLASAPPDRVVAALADAPPTPETTLRRIRAELDAGHLDRVAELVAAAEDEAARDGLADWRVGWWAGVAALTAGDHATASTRFADVYAELPGELAPKLAAGYAAELGGDTDAATGYYGLVTAVDAGYAAAHFGLARARVALGDRAGAAAALRAVPRTSGAYPAAQETLAQVLSADMAGAGPEVADLLAASAAVEALGADAELRARLVVAVLSSALRTLQAGSHPTTAGAASPEVLVGGIHYDERSVRLGLERACRSLARFAGSRQERIAMVERANRLRPRSLL